VFADTPTRPQYDRPTSVDGVCVSSCSSSSTPMWTQCHIRRLQPQHHRPIYAMNVIRRHRSYYNGRRICMSSGSSAFPAARTRALTPVGLYGPPRCDPYALPRRLILMVVLLARCQSNASL